LGVARGGKKKTSGREFETLFAGGRARKQRLKPENSALKMSARE